MFVAQACSQTKAQRQGRQNFVISLVGGSVCLPSDFFSGAGVRRWISLSRSARWGSEWYSTLLWLEIWSVMVGGLDGILMSLISTSF